MKNLVPVYLLIIALFGLFFWVFQSLTTPVEIKNEAYTIGEIIAYGSGGKTAGSDAIIEYWVKGISYSTRLSSSRFIANVLGEKFTVVYDSLKPSESVVLLCNPIFLNSEDTLLADGVITRFYKFGIGAERYISNKGVEFEFSANGETYKKAQVLPPNFETKFTNVEKGNHFEVHYWLSDPERAIMCFDIPLK